MSSPTLAERFNGTGFSRLLNTRAGRVFRLGAGTGFLVLGIALAPAPVGIASLAWSVLPLTAGGFDVCWISAALGGPLRGARIRATR